MTLSIRAPRWPRLAPVLLVLGCARGPAQPAPAAGPTPSAAPTPRKATPRKATPRRRPVVAVSPTPPADPPTSPAADPAGATDAQEGLATWYGGRHHGGPTASGERFDKRAMTAAHRTLPMGTRVRVTHQKNGRSVEVRINDRGPFGNKRRIIDLSEAAARKLDMIDEGVAPVRVEVVTP